MRLRIILFLPSYQLQNIWLNLLKALSGSVHGLSPSGTRALVFDIVSVIYGSLGYVVLGV